MSIVYLLAPLALLLSLAAGLAFVWSVKQGQYEDLDTDSQRLFLEEE